MKKKEARLKRAKRIRARIDLQGANRLCIFRSPKHIYAQIIAPGSEAVIASASTVEKDLKSEVKNGGNIAAAAVVGKAIAERAKKAGIDKVAFDRSGYKYHGRVKALAEAARENGMEF